jgi:hypothetical protein
VERSVLSLPVLFFLDFPLVYDRTCARVREGEREERERDRERERESGKR